MNMMPMDWHGAVTDTPCQRNTAYDFIAEVDFFGLAVSIEPQTQEARSWALKNKLKLSAAPRVAVPMLDRAARMGLTTDWR